MNAILNEPSMQRSSRATTPQWQEFAKDWVFVQTTGDSEEVSYKLIEFANMIKFSCFISPTFSSSPGESPCDKLILLTHLQPAAGRKLRHKHAPWCWCWYYNDYLED